MKVNGSFRTGQLRSNSHPHLPHALQRSVVGTAEGRLLNSRFLIFRALQQIGKAVPAAAVPVCGRICTGSGSHQLATELRVAATDAAVPVAERVNGEGEDLLPAVTSGNGQALFSVVIESGDQAVLIAN